MEREVTTTGFKKLETLMKQFNEHFPFKRIKLLSSNMAAKAEKGETIYGLDIEKTLSQVREKTGSGKMSFTGRKNVKTNEREFDELFGLYLQICFTESDGKRYYTKSSGDSKTLTVLNREKEAAGCKKDIWN